MLAEPSAPGFVFDNVLRNERIEQQLAKSTGQKTLPKAAKTGTTIVGCIFDSGVVLGADTRATAGSIVFDKNCSKIHYLADNMYCCGAGTAADTEMVTRQISAQIRLHRMQTGRVPRVTTAKQLLADFLFRYQGYIGAALVMGGVDATGSHLYSISPHGYVDATPYQTMGSGSLAAMAVLETGYRPGIGQEQAVRLVRNAVAAGVFNDLGSGSNIDLCVIKADSVQYLRPYEVANEKGQREQVYHGGKVALKQQPVQRRVLADIVSTRIIRDQSAEADKEPMET